MFVSYPRRRYKMIHIIIAATPTVAAAVKMLQKSFRLSTSQPADALPSQPPATAHY